jgi:hypothetical protein
MRNSVTIRMGAPYWDVTIRTRDGIKTYDLRTMDKAQRSVFHREFMNAFRKTTK